MTTQSTLETADFYKIASPTTKQIFDAIVNNEYTPIEKIIPKAKQIKVLLLKHLNTDEILVTFSGVTNLGGHPIFLSTSFDLHEIASDNDDQFNTLSEEDQEQEIDLLGAYMRTYDDIFNL